MIRRIATRPARKYQSAFQKCLKDAKKIGVPVSNKISHRLEYGIMLGAWGYTYKGEDGKFHIGITRQLYSDFADEGYLSTSRTGALCSVLYHELIHTVDGCWNHGPQWKKWAKVLNQSGCNLDLTPNGNNPPPWKS